MSIQLGVSAVFNNDTDGTPNQLDITGTTAGRGLVAIAYIYSGSPSITSVTVSGESNMTLIGSLVTNGNWSLQLAYLSSLSAGGTHTVTLNYSTASNNNSGLKVYELYDTVSGGIALDGHNETTGSTANPSMTVTTTAANSAILGFIYPDSSPTAGANYTEDSIAWFGTEKAQYDLDAGGAGSITFDWSMSAAGWAMAAAGFKAAAAAASSNAKLVKTWLQ